jgi:hypothetical protein
MKSTKNLGTFCSEKVLLFTEQTYFIMTASQNYSSQNVLPNVLPNSTAVSYINKGGETHSPTLAYLAIEIWNFCISRQIWITARHVPGVMNTEADFASRNFNNRTEWTLNKRVFQMISRRFYTPEVDLFVSRINNQLPRYVAKIPRVSSNICFSPALGTVDGVHTRYYLFINNQGTI